MIRSLRSRTLHFIPKKEKPYACNMIRFATFTTSSIPLIPFGDPSASLHDASLLFAPLRHPFTRYAHKFRHHSQEKLLQSIPLMLSQVITALGVCLQSCKLANAANTTMPPFSSPYSFHSFQSLHLPPRPAKKTGLEKLDYNGIKHFDCTKIMATFKSSIDIVPVTGDYWCTSDRTLVRLEAGTKFPPCPARDHRNINYWTNVNPYPPPPPPPIPDHLHERFSVMLRIEGVVKRVQIRPQRRTINLHLIPSQYTISVVNQTYDQLYQDHHGWHLKDHHSNVQLLKELLNEINKHYQRS